MASTSSGSFGYRIDSDRQGKSEIVGLRETQKALKALGDATKKELKSTHKEAAQIVVDGAMPYVPVRTGALGASMRAAATQTSGKVRVGNAAVPYAGAIHFGWPARRIKPQPFIYDTLDGRRQEIAALYRERIFQLVKKYDLYG
jgi:HK97 gp10 family phage protein